MQLNKEHRLPLGVTAFDLRHAQSALGHHALVRISQRLEFTARGHASRQARPTPTHLQRCPPIPQLLVSCMPNLLPWLAIRLARPGHRCSGPHKHISRSSRDQNCVRPNYLMPPLPCTRTLPSIALLSHDEKCARSAMSKFQRRAIMRTTVMTAPAILGPALLSMESEHHTKTLRRLAIS